MGNLKVLMMGGRRCGKTTALASLFDQMKHTPAIYELLTVADKTILETKTIDGVSEKQEGLNNKKLELQSFLRNYNSSDFLVDKGPTRNFWLYNMQITLAGTNKTMNMEFRDSAGEFFDYGGAHTNETMQYVKDCDVFIVVVDTPYLMCDDDAVSCAANATDSIHTFLSSIDENSDEIQEAKFVMFVPIKCEKWIHEGKINEVNQKIRQVYGPSINHLKNRDNTEISIIPIQTAGSIDFSEMREPYVVVSPDGTLRKCSKVTDKTVILSNGKMCSIKPEDVLNEDPDGVFKFDDDSLDIKRPSSWYHHSSKEPKYAPQNCEQIALHVLRFMLNKARKNQSSNRFVQFFRGVFGAITLNDLNNTIVELTNKGLIKDFGDGIERIQPYS